MPRHHAMPMPPDEARRTKARRKLRHDLLIALLCVVWSSTWWAIRVCLEAHPPLPSAAVRFAIAGITMALLAPRLRRLERAPAPPTWLWLAFGSSNFAVGYGVLYCAETVVPSGVAAVLWSVFPILMASSAVCFLGERLRLMQWLGFAVASGGIVVVFAGDLGGSGAAASTHAWLLLLSPVAATFGLTLAKKYGSHCSSIVLNQNGMLFGAVLLALAATMHDPEAWLLMRWPTSVVLATVYLAVMGTTMTFAIYMWLLRTAPASQLSLINYVTPLLAMAFAVAVGDGHIDASTWLGTALVAAGVAMVVRR